MRRARFLFYVILGFLFGIFDWYFLELIRILGSTYGNDISNSILQLIAVMVVITANYGIWLVPIVPAVLYEYRKSKSKVRTCFVGSLVWSTSVISYYIFYLLSLVFIGLPDMDFMLWKNRSGDYWENFKPVFRKVIVNQFLEWILIAVVGGCIIGICTVLAVKVLQRIGKKK